MKPVAPQFSLLLTADLGPGDVTTRRVPPTRDERPDVEAAIEAAWRTMLARPGVNLFDGPICRFEAFHFDAGRLTVDLSRTSYRVLVGTNFCNPQFIDTHGRRVMADAIGVSTGLLTADGWWVMGRRNRRVAYYPGRVHPFAGSIELAEHIDLFANAERELREELRLQQSHINGTRFVGLVEDLTLRHPEAIFFARTTKARDAVIAGLDADEHDGTWAVASTADAVAAAFGNDELTPVARAVLLLGGRVMFGQAWFDGHNASAGAV